MGFTTIFCVPINFFFKNYKNIFNFFCETLTLLIKKFIILFYTIFKKSKISGFLGCLDRIIK